MKIMNFLNLGVWYDFVMNEILGEYKNIKKARKGYVNIGARNYNDSYEHEVSQQRIFRIVNSMIYIITDMIDLTLQKFMVRCNLEDMSRNMANISSLCHYTAMYSENSFNCWKGVAA